MSCKIYTLEHPITGEVRYVGKTMSSLKRRLQGHMCCHKSLDHRSNWINSLKKEGLKPIIELIDEVRKEDWEEMEEYWIQQFKAWGFNLVNATSGGKGVDNQSIQAKIRISKSKTNGKKIQEYNKSGEPVKIFDNIYEIVDAYGFKRQSVLDVLCGLRKFNYGRNFKYI